MLAALVVVARHFPIAAWSAARCSGCPIRRLRRSSACRPTSAASCACAARRDRRRHSAVHADRRRDGGVVVAVGGVVAQLFLPALRAAARRRVDRHRRRADAGDRRAASAPGPRRGVAAAQSRALRDRARSGAAGRGRRSRCWPADRRAGCSNAARSAPRDTAAVAAALAAIALGLPGHALEKVLGAVSFAHEDTRTPMLTALAGLAVSASARSCCSRLRPRRRGAAIALSGWVGAAAARHRSAAPPAGSLDARLPARGCRASSLATMLMGIAVAAYAGRAGDVSGRERVVESGRSLVLALAASISRPGLSMLGGAAALRGRSESRAILQQGLAASDSASGPCARAPRRGMGHAAHQQRPPQWRSSNACFPACSRPATCISATISARS